ncbi:FUSC family protein [Amycolatopsis jiangsuensis]|uniref:Putative membrane protein YccC n=1 Tax=Amycolatopsis jiangsuensis TaxID=1181879 RepID=A0A840J6C9_9PSEU|nr:FUSC family protein [Amycolatopsis jiangsuensis]MBB4689155.1 putative membrane protein YccC [Amycolatopsis jiangsuensis]
MNSRLDRTPIGWIARALRTPGRERRTLVQTAKATFAAVASWLLATQVIGLPQPFLAPYAAVFLVESTVYRSLYGWVQQVGAVATGVVLAALATLVIPEQTVVLAVVLFAGLLIGSWYRFGSSGVWAGVTGMLLITYGNAGNSELLGDRLLETALGAAIGLAVNMLIVPPLYGERLAVAGDRLAAKMAGLLEDTAELVRTDEPEAEIEDWLRSIRDVRSMAREAEEADRMTREGRFLNLRRRSRHTGLRHDRPLRALRGLWPPVEQLVNSVRTASQGREPFRYPWPQARDALAELLLEFATAIRSAGTPGTTLDLDRCRELLDQVEDHLVSSDRGVTATLGLGAMALPARRLLQQLDDG